MSVQNNMVIDVAVLCHEYTELQKMCDDHVINLDDICISKEIFRKIFYFYGENFGMDKKIVNTEELLPYVSFLPKHRKIEREKFYLLEHILRNLEDDLGVSRNCFTPDTRVQLTSEINSLNSLCDMNCCSVLASLTWSNLLNIIDILRCELINKDNSFSINEELKQLKIEHLTLTKLYENAKIESSNAIIILKHANERNYILQERYKLLKMELQELKSISNNICTICCENIINISCVPCGHTYCEKCIRIPENNNCYICRQNFYRIIKIYL
jgi:hypothetical protein